MCIDAATKETNPPGASEVSLGWKGPSVSVYMRLSIFDRDCVTGMAHLIDVQPVFFFFEMMCYNPFRPTPDLRHLGPSNVLVLFGSWNGRRLKGVLTGFPFPFGRLLLEQRQREGI